jgi:predicted nucleic acid-binding protein
VLVADASVIAPAMVDGGPDGDRIRRRLRGERLAAPDLMKVEALSVIRRRYLVGRLDRAFAEQAVTDLLTLPIIVYPAAPLLLRCWQLRDNLTAYDAAYVALAEALGCSLLTADVRLANAAGLDCPVEVI